ncbi:MAG: hypothetical protein FWH27_00210 [Planctomycetaceae bacterium]|nr:hypothetical protein [Planctomycetaceae bacterium]
MQNEITSSISDYLTELERQYETGFAREHTYRPALQQLLAAMLSHLIVSNEPARQACGAPDLILLRKEDTIPVSFVEAKDIDDPDLTGRKANQEQFDRYKRSLDNIIFTDYLDFLRYEKWQHSGNDVHINEAQYFGHVPPETWEFSIGGYQPAQKWLKDRKGRKLTYNDISHYQRIIRALKETGNIMLEVDEAMG